MTKMTEEEKKIMDDVQNMDHAELVSEYMDLHAAYVNAEQVIAHYESCLQDLDFLINECRESVE